MTETACKRCGWRHAQKEPQWADVGEGKLMKLPDEMTSPHPSDACNSPFALDQVLFLAHGAVQDLPPLRVTFQGLIEIEAPIYVLHEGEWIKESDALPVRCEVLLDPRSAVYPEHKKVFGDDLGGKLIEVELAYLVPADRWPVLEE